MTDFIVNLRCHSARCRAARTVKFIQYDLLGDYCTFSPSSCASFSFTRLICFLIVEIISTRGPQLEQRETHCDDDESITTDGITRTFSIFISYYGLMSQPHHGRCAHIEHTFLWLSSADFIRSPARCVVRCHFFSSPHFFLITIHIRFMFTQRYRSTHSILSHSGCLAVC